MDAVQREMLRRLEALRTYHRERAHYLTETIIDLQDGARRPTTAGRLARDSRTGHAAGLEKPRRRFSKAARERMSEGMRRFWQRRKAAAAKK